MALGVAVLILAGWALSVFLAADRRLEERQHARLQEVRAAPLTPLQSDGCSGGLSTVWNALPLSDLPFEVCCVAHDRAYHAGGGEATPRGGYMARLGADRRLRACVADTGGQAVAEAMFGAVRLGGGPCSGLPWRWGYGRPDCP